jgi:excisionase family DNA binding protein
MLPKPRRPREKRIVELTRVTYTIAEFCEMTGIGRATLLRSIEDGSLRTVRVGTRRLSSSPLTANLIPDYLRNVYAWAYLTPWLTGFLDRQVVVQAILWGNAQRLIRDVLTAVKPGDRIFQPAAVYGSFSRQLAEQIGRHGRLEVRDIAPLQVTLTRQKLAGLSQVQVACGNAVDPERGEFDGAMSDLSLQCAQERTSYNIEI